MNPVSKHLNSIILLALITIFLLGAGLRVVSFQSNTRLYGDVNLFSITAREYVRTGYLHYPYRSKLKNNVTSEVSPFVSPATTHNLLYPFMGGVISKAIGSERTFDVLKLLNIVIGLIVVACAVYLVSFDRSMMVITGLLFAVSPLLIDYSANASLYIVSVLIILLMMLLFYRFQFDDWRYYVIGGLLCSLGFQNHSSMISLIPAFMLFLLFYFRQVRWKLVIFFAIAFVISYLPSMLWDLTYFGTLTHSDGLAFLLKRWNLSEELLAQIDESRLNLFNLEVLQAYLDYTVPRFGVFLDNLHFEFGLPLLFVALVGTILAIRRHRKFAIAVLLPSAMYFIIIMTGYLHHTRFAVPLIPMILIMAAYCFAYIVRYGAGAKITVTVVVIVYASWSIWSLFTLETPLARYYRDDENFNVMLDEIYELASELLDYPLGVISGCEYLLRGIYILDFPMIRTNCEPKTKRIIREQEHRQLRYVFGELSYLRMLEQDIPGSTIILEKARFGVLELTPP